jgi:hypothetical protein
MSALYGSLEGREVPSTDTKTCDSEKVDIQ